MAQRIEKTWETRRAILLMPQAYNSQSKRQNLEGDLQDQLQKTPSIKNQKMQHSCFSYAMQARATN